MKSGYTLLAKNNMNPQKGVTMEYRSLGRTGVPVSNLCLGCMNFGWKTAEAESLEMIDKAVNSDINFLDSRKTLLNGLYWSKSFDLLLRY